MYFLITIAILVYRFYWLPKTNTKTAWALYTWVLRSFMIGGVLVFHQAEDMGFIEKSAISIAFGFVMGNVWDRGLQYFGLRNWVAGLGWGGGGTGTQRGAAITDAKSVNKMVKKSGVPAELVIGEITVPVEVEPLHFLFAGSIGTGKSLAFTQTLTYARAKEHRAIVADLGGEFTKNFYRHEHDFILNPFDARGYSWSPFAEMRAPFDAARLAASMVPDGAGDQKEWNVYARTILEVVLERLWEANKGTNSALCWYCLGASTTQLAALCQGSSAAPYFGEGAERMLGSIRGILSGYLKPYTYLDPDAGQDYKQTFSIRQVLEFPGDHWLFITYRDDQLKAMAPLIAAWVDICASAILSTSSNEPRPTWFFLDEFSTLGKMNSIEPLLTKGRKYGVRAVLGYQSISQPRLTYGNEGAQTLLACLGTWLVLKQPDPDSAEYMSKFIGDEEIRRIVNSGSDGGNQGGQSNNWAEQTLRQRAVMPTELQNMASRVGILNIAGPIPPAWTSIPLPNFSGESVQPFVDPENPIRAMLLVDPEAGQDPDLSFSDI